MANIPPLLSSSPPPLNITNEPDDFIDAISNNDYEYEVISDQCFNSEINDGKKAINHSDNGFITQHVQNAKTNYDPHENELNYRFLFDGICMDNSINALDSYKDSSTIEKQLILETNVPEMTNSIEVLCHTSNNEVQILESSINNVTKPFDSPGDQEIISTDLSCTIPDNSAQPYEISPNNIDVKHNYLTESLSNGQKEINSLSSIEHRENLVIEFPNLDNKESSAQKFTCISSNMSKNVDEDNSEFDNFVYVTNHSDIDSNKLTLEKDTQINKILMQKIYSETPNQDSPVVSYQNDMFSFNESELPNNHSVIDVDESICIQSDPLSDKFDSDDEEFIFQDHNLNKSNDLVFDKIHQSNEASVADSNLISNSNDKNDSAEFSEDFGDFNSFATESTNKSYTIPNISNMFDKNHIINNDSKTLYDQLLSTIKMMFPLDTEDSVLENDLSESIKINVSDFLKKDVDLINSTKFKWKSSQIYDKTLSALNIDSRNIIFGSRWNDNMPRFASNLVSGALEPLKPIPAVITSATSQNTNNSLTYNNAKMPATQFDWIIDSLENSMAGSTVNDSKNNMCDLKLVPEIFSEDNKVLNSTSEVLKSSIAESFGIDKYSKTERKDNVPTSINAMNSVSFNLPESHIFTLPTSEVEGKIGNVDQKNLELLQQKTYNNILDPAFNMTPFDLEFNTENNKFKKSFSKDDTMISVSQQEFNNDLLTTKEMLFTNKMSDATISHSLNLNDMTSNNASNFNLPNDKTINNFKTINNEINKSSSHSETKCVDNFDTSFTDFQAYEINNKPPDIVHTPATEIQKTLTELSPLQLRPAQKHSTILTNEFRNEHASSDSAFNIDDSHAEWSDFVSITTVCSEPSSVGRKETIDINAFKVPIQFNLDEIKNTSKDSSKSIDLDDWTDFVSSTPTPHSGTNRFNKVDTCERWKRTTPQFNNWTSNSFHAVQTDYVLPQNSNGLNSTTKHSKIDSKNVYFNQSSKQNGFVQSNGSFHSVTPNGISSISSVPELTFSMPQSLSYLKNLSKK